MRKFSKRAALIALCSAATLTILSVSDASAQKKPSYDQAMAQCKSQVDRAVPGDQPSARYSAGAACMKKLGYRLKKKTSF